MRHVPWGQRHVQNAHGEAGLGGPSWMGMGVKRQHDQSTSADSELLTQVRRGVGTHQPRPEPFFGSFIPCLITRLL